MLPCVYYSWDTGEKGLGIAACCSVLQCVAVCVAVCCSVLMCVAVCVLTLGTNSVEDLGIALT